MTGASLVRAGRLGTQRRAWVAGAAVMAWLVGLASASPTGWSGPIRLSARDGTSDYPQVAFDRSGDAVAVWDQERGSSSSYVVMASRRRSGGSWTRPVRLSPLGADSEVPELAVAPSGAAVVLWDNNSVSARRPPFVQAVSRSSWSAPWRRPVRISPAGAEADNPALAIDASGAATAVWTISHPGHNRVQSATASAARGAWSSPVAVATSRGQLLWPQVAVNGRGDAVAAWLCCSKGSVLRSGLHHVVMAAARPAGPHGWRSPVELGSEYEPRGQGLASFEFPGPRLSIDAHGGAVVVWQHKVGGKVIAVAAFKPPATRWRSAAPISRHGALVPHVAMDAAGDATAIWEGRAANVFTASTSGRSGGWSRPRDLGPGDPYPSPYPHVAVDPRGAAIATWTGNAVEAAVRRQASGKWGATAKLGGGVFSEPAIDRFATGLVVWQRFAKHPAAILVEAAARR